jgi:L-threonylcarbamoyladenylate synthase
MTEVFRVAADPAADVIRKIADVIRRNGVVLMPTDTIYGLHALATSEAAIERITALKEREEAKPFVVLGASMSQFEAIGVEFSDRTRRILEELWPGPLTAVLSLNKTIAASRGAKSLAVRVPDLQWLRELLTLSGPLASTSANISGRPPIAAPEDAPRDWHDRLDAIVDAGRREGKPSSIVDFTGDEPRLIREGESFFTQKVWKTLRKSL